MRLGTYSTIDAPTKNIDKAFDYLWNEFEKINGYVRKVSNSHDFGDYPSFEIDYPLEIENIDPEYDDECSVEDQKKYDNWHDQANKIEADYNKKFEKYL